MAKRKPNPGPGPGGEPGPNRNGGGGGGGGGDKKKKRGKLARRATRDVNLFQQPLLDALDREAAQARADTEQYQNQLGVLYSGLKQALGGLGDPFMGATNAIREQYKGDIGFLGDLVGQPVPGNEQMAAGGLAGNMGSGILGLLATDQQRGIGYNTSAQRQGAIERVSTGQNALTDLQDVLKRLSEERLSTARMTPDLLKQRLDELRDQRLQQQGTKGLQAFLEAQIGGIRPPRRRGRGKGGGGGGGGQSTGTRGGVKRSRKQPTPAEIRRYKG